jgi:hypothetical protein
MLAVPASRKSVVPSQFQPAQHPYEDTYFNIEYRHLAPDYRSLHQFEQELAHCQFLLDYPRITAKWQIMIFLVTFAIRKHIVLTDLRLYLSLIQWILMLTRTQGLPFPFATAWEESFGG